MIVDERERFNTSHPDLCPSLRWKRIYLNEYVAPGKDGFGARFIFPRNFEGKPFLGADNGEVRFYSQFSVGSRALKLDRRFKLADMMYDGELEY